MHLTGETWYGPVESWMTCEDFASVLVKQRGLKSPSGWTISLVDSRNFCEPSGVDYVLDMVSEMELAPSFPAGKSFFLVSGQQPSHGRQGGRMKRVR